MATGAPIPAAGLAGEGIRAATPIAATQRAASPLAAVDAVPAQQAFNGEDAAFPVPGGVLYPVHMQGAPVSRMASPVAAAPAAGVGAVPLMGAAAGGAAVGAIGANALRDYNHFGYGAPYMPPEARAPYGYGWAAPPEGPVNTTLFLRPIAAPSAIGLLAFFGGTWIFSTWLAGWYGSSFSPCEFWPFLIIFPGIVQLICGIFGFHARDNFATIFHLSNSAFYIWLALWWGLNCIGVLPGGAFSDPLGHQHTIAMVLVVLFFIYSALWLASIGRDLIMFALCGLYWVGLLLLFIGYFTGANGLIKVGAYFWIFSSLFAFWRGIAWLIAENHHFGWLPVFHSPLQRYNPLVKIPIGEPGIKKVQ